MPWPKWVVLIAGSTGSALRAVCPPHRHIKADALCDALNDPNAVRQALYQRRGNHLVRLRGSGAPSSETSIP
jgi:hypothetical protein